MTYGKNYAYKIVNDVQSDTAPREEAEKAWYAVYTIVRHEKSVDGRLTDNDIETFLPLMEVESQWKDRKKKVFHPLFPGYLFVRISSDDAARMISILNTRGVVRILSSNGSYEPIPSKQIESVRRLLEARIEFDPYKHLIKGTEVMVVNGPLKGVRGRVLDRKSGHRLIVSIDIIKRSVSVVVDPADLEIV